MPRVTITVPDGTPQPYRFQLDRRSVTLGRGSENDIPIECGSVSVKHAEMRRVDGGYELRDLGSTNGIKKNGERREVIALRNGIAVTMGDVAFDFLLAEEELESLARERPLEDSPVLPELKESESGDKDPDEACKNAHEETDEDEETITSSAGGTLAMVILFLILAAAAFFAGMAMRYQKDTGGSLIEAVQSKIATPQPTAPAAPAETE